VIVDILVQYILSNPPKTLYKKRVYIIITKYHRNVPPSSEKVFFLLGGTFLCPCGDGLVRIEVWPQFVGVVSGSSSGYGRKLTG
jgi:hypothetical protein